MGARLKQCEVYLQNSQSDCGPAALSSIFSFYNTKINPRDLIKKIKISIGGISASQMVELSHELNFESKIIKLDIDTLRDLEVPCILCVINNEGIGHYLVYNGQIKGKFFCIDPAIGKVYLNEKELSDLYVGFAIILRPNGRYTPQILSQTDNRSLLLFLKEFKKQIFIFFMAGLFLSAITFSLTYLSKYFIDQVVPSKNTDKLLYFVAVIVLANLFIIVYRYLNSTFLLRFGQKFYHDLSLSHMKEYLKIKYSEILRRDPGELLVNFDGLENISESLVYSIAPFVLQIVNLVFSALILSFLFTPYIAIFISILIFLNAVHILGLVESSSIQVQRGYLQQGEEAKLVYGFLRDIRILKIFNLEKWFFNKYKNLVVKKNDIERKNFLLGQRGTIVNSILSLFVDGGIYIYSGLKIINGSLTVGDFLILYSYSTQMFSLGQSIPMGTSTWVNFKKDFGRFLDIIQADKVGSTGEKVESIESLELRGASFSYNACGEFLKSVNLSLKKGDRVALIGPSGAGKTTLLNIISGFLKPDNGEYFINSKNFNDISPESFQRFISFSFQDVPIFSGTVEQNISINSTHVNKDELYSSLKNKVRNLENEAINDLSLSGGEKRIVGNLRSLSIPHDCLICDEPLSQLDLELREDLLTLLERHLKNIAISIMVTHDKDILRVCNKYIYLNEGQIIEVADVKDINKSSHEFVKRFCSPQNIGH